MQYHSTDVVVGVVVVVTEHDPMLTLTATTAVATTEALTVDLPLVFSGSGIDCGGSEGEIVQNGRE